MIKGEPHRANILCKLSRCRFFTQTRPMAGAATQLTYDHDGAEKRPSALADKSVLSLMGFGFDEFQHPDPSQTSGTRDNRSLPAVISTQDTHTLRRLKRRVSHDGADEEVQPYLSPRVDDGDNNAFHRMMNAAKQPREKLLGRSNLVDDHAEESDEDNGWAPIGGPEEEEDEDEEDGYVPDLVDDARVDDEEKRRQDELAAEKARYVERHSLAEAVLTVTKRGGCSRRCSSRNRGSQDNRGAIPYQAARA